MRTYKTTEQEINHIRLEIYDETKNMSPTQRRNRLSAIVDDDQKEFGVRRVKSLKENLTECN